MSVDWSLQRFWEDVALGDSIPEISFPLSYHRMIVQAAANRDFSAIHINSEAARAQGAPEIYANNVFHQSMWERTVREFIGLDGTIKKIGPFRMKAFCTVGETVVVRGTIARKWTTQDSDLLELQMSSSISAGEAVVGSVTVTLPRRATLTRF